MLPYRRDLTNTTWTGARIKKKKRLSVLWKINYLSCLKKPKLLIAKENWCPEMFQERQLSITNWFWCKNKVLANGTDFFFMVVVMILTIFCHYRVCTTILWRAFFHKAMPTAIKKARKWTLKGIHNLSWL